MIRKYFGIETKLNVDYLENKEEELGLAPFSVHTGPSLCFNSQPEHWNIMQFRFENEILDKPNFQDILAM